MVVFYNPSFHGLTQVAAYLAYSKIGDFKSYGFNGTFVVLQFLKDVAINLE
jgi:hypothetical protein